MLYPLAFHPRFKERVWGGRRLGEFFGKPLPSGTPIGESWEIVDRSGDASVIANGPLAGRDLRWLMEHHAADLLGPNPPERFPLLAKIIDANQDLSVQVHPPASVAEQLGGEPKTETWYVIHASPGARIYAGLRTGVTRDTFAAAINEGTVEDCLHALPVKPGDALHLPSGRLHALGRGVMVFEIQQNSDTTYRVYDWNRPGLNGQPRELHLQPALASIHFDDHEPGLHLGSSTLADTPGPYTATLHNLAANETQTLPGGRATVIGIMEGKLTLCGGDQTLTLAPGHFALLPAALETANLRADTPVTLLEAQPA